MSKHKKTVFSFRKRSTDTSSRQKSESQSHVIVTEGGARKPKGKLPQTKAVKPPSPKELRMKLEQEQDKLFRELGLLNRVSHDGFEQTYKEVLASKNASWQANRDYLLGIRGKDYKNIHRETMQKISFLDEQLQLQ